MTPILPSLPRRRARALLVAAVLAAAAPVASASPLEPVPRADADRSATGRANAQPSTFQRACGSIRVAGRRLRIDVAEGDAKLVTCAQARRVGSRFVGEHDDRFRVAGHTWSCYKARADGQGWAYHCLRHGASNRFVDVGIGRRW